MPYPYQISTDEYIAKVREKFAEGKIAFRPPEEMTVSKTETLEARITHQQQISTEGLKGSGQPIIESLKV